MFQEESEWQPQTFSTKPRRFVEHEIKVFISSTVKDVADQHGTYVGISEALGISDDSHTLLPTTGTTWIFPENEITRILVESFKAVPQVKSICSESRKHNMAIWTILESDDRDARKEIYKRELQIGERFRLRDFDFRVTSLDLITPEELKNTGFVELYRRD